MRKREEAKVIRREYLSQVLAGSRAVTDVDQSLLREVDGKHFQKALAKKKTMVYIVWKSFDLVTDRIGVSMVLYCAEMGGKELCGNI